MPGSCHPQRVTLTRQVRLNVPLTPTAGMEQAPVNSLAGWPPIDSPAMSLVLDVAVQGDADPTTGYVLNINHIDKLTREVTIPIVHDIVAHPSSNTSLTSVLSRLFYAMRLQLKAQLQHLTWHLSPYQTIAMHTSNPSIVLIEEEFEFAAAHRLHCETLSDAENRDYFGKCNNPHGHGHNYRLRPSIVVPLDPQHTNATLLGELRRIINERIVLRFDHKHLNLDVPEFRALNPSVENIARVSYQLLHDPIAAIGGRLLRVTVWETPKTSCTYPAFDEAKPTAQQI